ncbi:hypothetical protein EHS25_004223 [Saitozyma podzolica]|uniref:Aminotransferase class I/classII large domain-containing protein n=1 Tax=Saitozyma podzolica TaxID=1890683 RepID=A0A427YTH7_9TREE|nr:hypothetical protein EHS25_004223 [Saitozyma podzolica]
MALNFAIAPAVEGTNSPPIPKAQAWARSYLSGSPSLPLLDLSQGVPRDAPHPAVLSSLADASSDPSSARYGPILGEPTLREAVAEEIRVQYGLQGHAPNGNGHGEDPKPTLTAENVGITTGCNMAFLTLLMALCPPGSSVLLPSQHTSTTRCVSPSNGKSVRMIVLITPNNPTGSVMPPKVIREWYHLAREFGVALVLDETYRDFVEGKGGQRGKPHDLFGLEDWGSTLVSLGSFSKGYRIPGHRLGSIIAAPALLKHITTICDCMQICAPRPPQIALGPLLPTLRPDLLSSSSALSSRRHLFHKTIGSVPGWSVASSGGFFAPVWEGLKGGEQLQEDRWLRFAVANVDDEVVVQLGPRLRRMNELMGMIDD